MKVVSLPGGYLRSQFGGSIQFETHRYFEPEIEMDVSFSPFIGSHLYKYRSTLPCGVSMAIEQINCMVAFSTKYEEKVPTILGGNFVLKVGEYNFESLGFDKVEKINDLFIFSGSSKPATSSEYIQEINPLQGFRARYFPSKFKEVAEFICFRAVLGISGQFRIPLI